VSSRDVAGYDVAAVEAWVTTRLPQLKAPFEWSRLTGGHSNLTYMIRSADGEACAVVRRPPLGELLPGAHDMSREWACISAMWGRVPVAEPLAFCEDPSVSGAHFYVMGLVDAHALYTVDDVDRHIGANRRMQAAESWIDTLADIHSLDIDEIGLAGLGKREGYLARQARTWYRSWSSCVEAAGIDDPRIHELHDRLVAEIPEQGPATVVHGDYGTHNVMFDSDARVAAVLDWEIATLGDPLADLGYSMNAWVQPGDRFLETADAPSLATGFPARDQLVARYAERTGRDVSNLEYYRTFNRFKTACILHGVYARYRRGQKAIAASELEAMRLRVLRVIDDAAAQAEALWAP